MQYLIVVDIGMQSTCAAVMEESGKILTQAFKETKLVYEGDRWGWQEPNRMYGDAVETVKAAVEKARIFPPAGGGYLYGRANGGHYGNREKGRSGYAL